MDRPEAAESAATSGGPRGTARGRLLDAAEELFASRGYAATTTRQIAEHAGASTGMVFYHFPSKADLLATLLTERSPRADLGAILERRAGDPRGALADLAEAIARTVEERGAVLRIMLRAEEGEAADLFNRFLEEAVGALAAHLHGELASADLTHPEARAMAQAFLSAILYPRLLRLPAELQPPVADTVDVVLRGYA